MMQISAETYAAAAEAARAALPVLLDKGFLAEVILLERKAVMYERLAKILTEKETQMKSLDAIVAANEAVKPGYSGKSEKYIDQQARGSYARRNYEMQLAELRHTLRISRNGMQARICTYCGADEKRATLCDDPLCTMLE